ncbi:hypothetical protein AQI95_21535 [Streptomyces yokosukanensis]|uniref:Uncharacterized protein n=1 Tax=Streptomyces yokosukanensis TaxID=67386 RepID=A0A124HFJ0_9ACTN|nr:hypothetical protein [Streptomyces yokosukanensis]KUN04019.1 hypothetical protein AQI95_21535 [Streptomyces yokosukanensis]
MHDDDFTLVDAFALEVDEEEADRSAYTVSGEQALRLFGHENRIGIAIRAPERAPDAAAGPGQGDAVYDIGLMLVVHAHPECRFVWSRLVVDLTATPGAVVQDMVPSEVEETAVEVEARLGAGLKFATVLSAVDVEARPELVRRRTVHFPTVTASGTGFRKAYWDFMAKDDSYLHTNRELRLLVSAPADAPVVGSFSVRARLRMPGLKNLVPVRKKGGLETTVQLVPAPGGAG